MHSKVSVFSTGKMISLGTKHERHAEEDLNFVADYLAKAGLIKKRKLEVKTRNIVATLSLGYPIDLENIVSNTAHIICEPEQFPGAIYRSPIGVSILLFASGKAVIAGAKNLNQIQSAVKEIVRLSKLISSRAIPVK